MVGRRKITARVIVFLLLGAIVNVAVAWGCCYHDLGYADLVRPDPTVSEVMDSVGLSSDATISDSAAHVYSTLGVRQTDFTYVDSDELLVRIGVQSGLPLRSLSGYAVWDGGRHTFVEYGFMRRPGNPVGGWLPSHPIWLGFAVNTLFYAGILWLLFAAPFALRRRIRGGRIKRGLCPACAYPVGASEVCTECGKPIKQNPCERF
jgi:hypothetical protein